MSTEPVDPRTLQEAQALLEWALKAQAEYLRLANLRPTLIKMLEIGARQGSSNPRQDAREILDLDKQMAQLRAGLNQSLPRIKRATAAVGLAVAGGIDDAATSDVLQQAIGEYAEWIRAGRNPSLAAASTQTQPTRIGLEAGDPDVARIFVSHSSDDHIVVKALVELLRSALSIPNDQIRCTSLDGYRLPAGVHVDTQIRREVNGSELLLGVISPNGMASLYVAVELGARWGTERPLMPLLANVDASVLGAPLSSLNALSLRRQGEVLQLVGDVAKHLRLPLPRPEGYLDKVLAVVAACQDQAKIDAELG